MSRLSIADKTFLESVLGMGGGYVLDFSDGSFANFFADLDIDIYDADKYIGFGGSKANRLRALWKRASDVEVSAVLGALADYIEAKKTVGVSPGGVTDEQIARIREIGHDSVGGSPTTAVGAPVTITTEATVTDNRISLEIHEDIYRHIKPYLENGDYFHAVDESYKLVREKLRELTGSEKATDVFNQSAQNEKHYEVLFGKATATDAAEADFFRGVAYLHLGVQFLRNEKAHTLAVPLEPNLAVHYVSLASLSYDLITRYLSEETIQEIEQAVRDKRFGYRSATAFYQEFNNHRWLEGLKLPASMNSASVRRTLKMKWLKEADFTRSFDHSNIIFMRLELVADQLTTDDIDFLLALPTKDAYGNDQLAGMEQFLACVHQADSSKLSPKARERIAEVSGD